jgi:predicted PurR-regulated permease PerM
VTETKEARPTELHEGRSELWLWTVRGSGLALGVLGIALLALTVQASIDVLVLVLVSVLLAAALDPLVDRLRDRLPLTRVQTIALVYVGLVLLAVGTAVLMVPAAVSQLSSVSSRLPGLLADAKSWAASFEPAVVGTTAERLLQTLELSFIRGGVTGADPEMVVEFGLTAADAAIAVLTVVTLVFFWLISRESLQRFTLSLLPLRERGAVRAAWNQVEQRLGDWFRGQLTVMAAVGAMTTVAYLLLGLEDALLLGLFAGVAEIIPIVGPAIGAVPALISAFVVGGPELALVVAGVYVVIQLVEGHVLVPMVMRNAVGLPPFVVIIALLVGAAVAGLIGALLAVPVAAAIAVILERAQARSTPVALHRPDTIDEEEPPDAGEGMTPVDSVTGTAATAATPSVEHR